jgi:hypothetical protein
MLKFCLWLGIGLLVAGAAAGVAELLIYYQGSPWSVTFGSLWASIDRNSLVGFQAIIENDLSPVFWPPIQLLFTIPAWLLLVPPGLVLVFACRHASRRP